jgi:hypothetical protein
MSFKARVFFKFELPLRTGHIASLPKGTVVVDGGLFCLTPTERKTSTNQSIDTNVLYRVCSTCREIIDRREMVKVKIIAESISNRYLVPSD